ncbi:MAG: DNA polymerase I [Lachnospiraceae bacterium]|nr:DNA polymerase I [Lachnospiraceae bacterium]
MSEKIVLIDGHSILNRAYYGLPKLTNAEGLYTNAILGFLNILFRILEEEKPDYLTVAFDVSAPTFRHKIYSAYKGTRKPMDEELRQQIPVMKDVLHSMGILTVEKPGLEADDILGTIATKAEEKGIAVSLVSGDRDLLQVATDRIKIRIPKTKPGGTEIEDYYAADVLERYQVTPKQFIELKALMGDTADNIPGVPKVGEKTATELMVTYGSIEAIYANLENITKNAIRTSLSENRELCDLSKTLATIDLHADFAYDFANAKVHDFFTPEAFVLFQKLGFKSFLSRFEDSAKEEEAPLELVRLTGKEEILEEIRRIGEGKEKAFAWYPIYDEEKFYGFVLADSAERAVLADLSLELTGDVQNACMAQLAEVTTAHTGIVFDLKNSLSFLEDTDCSHYFDVHLAAYLLNPLKSDITVADVALTYLQKSLEETAGLLKKNSLANLLREDSFRQILGHYGVALLKAYPILLEKLEQTGQKKLYDEIELPLTGVLHSMEEEGILVKPEALKEYGQALVGRIDELQKEIYADCGGEFNINSPKQLGEVLFEKMGIPGGKKTKTGYSTSADVLEKLSAEYPVVDKILEYRGLTKLKSTYADGLSAFIGEDNRIHTTFNQTITATGRLSSTDPNLQNIPMRLELGRRIRKVFIPKPGYVFVDADYSQIELRILAHMSDDDQLIEAYNQNADIHRITASKVFHVPFEEVTDLQRRNAKAVNFGIVYGISSFGLSQDLSISTKEAKAYIEQYFATYPGIKTFLDNSVANAKRDGYITTLYGRRRPIPEISSSNFMQRSFGERVAMNSPIQGTAADIIKIAMIRVYNRIKAENLKSRMILQIHDELLIETAEEEVEQVKTILNEEMMHAATLRVNMDIDVHVGHDWFEAK